ncbi:MAG: hypothetical protein P8103_05685 [Candidatus Thiodiazotropha sp.]
MTRRQWQAFGKRRNAEPEHPWGSLRACLCAFTAVLPPLAIEVLQRRGGALP